MALPASTNAETAYPTGSEAVLADRLLALYGEEGRIYRRLLDLCRRQVDMIRNGCDFSDLRDILEKKREELDRIAGLEAAESESVAAWRRGREGWTAEGRSRLHEALREVGGLIEEILLCEEECDRALLEVARAL